MKKTEKNRKKLHCVFMDLEKTCDTLPREELLYEKSWCDRKVLHVSVMQDMYQGRRKIYWSQLLLENLIVRLINTAHAPRPKKCLLICLKITAYQNQFQCIFEPWPLYLSGYIKRLLFHQ